MTKNREKEDGRIGTYRAYYLNHDRIDEIKEQITEIKDIPFLYPKKLRKLFLEVGALFFASLEANGLNGTKDIKIRRAIQEIKLKSRELAIRRDANEFWLRKFFKKTK